MLPNGDTTSTAVRDWAHGQAAYVGGNHLLLLLVLSHWAFKRCDNPEHAPVGQVLLAYSSSAAISAWTGLNRSTVRRILVSLQTDHGYLTWRPRPHDGSPGQPPNIIRLYWSTQFDMIRASHRQDQTALPPMFDPSPPQLRVIEFPTPRLVQDAPHD